MTVNQCSNCNYIWIRDLLSGSLVVTHCPKCGKKENEK